MQEQLLWMHYENTPIQIYRKYHLQQNVFMKHEHVPGHGHRSEVFCMSKKLLSKETYKPNMKALSETVQKLGAMLFFL